MPPARLGAYLRDFRALLRRARAARHAVRALRRRLHPRPHRLRPDERGGHRAASGASPRSWRTLVVAHGGSLSGEHGDGQARAELLPRMYGDGLVALFERFKDLWDPDGRLNPGMLVRPARLDENLRFAVAAARARSTSPSATRTTAATSRRPCAGASASPSAVRRGAGSADVMCPSFRATGEEQHSTRGRARLLHEMLAGEVVTDGWRSTEVRDALDLCLSCKGCRSDCPVGVDMATYKAEFLHHHYEGRRRPAAHYSMGWLPLWLRLAAAAVRAPLAQRRCPGTAAGRARETARRDRAGAGDPAAGARRPSRRWWRGSTRGEPVRRAWRAAVRSCCGRTPSPTTSRPDAWVRAAVRVLEDGGPAA